MFLKILENSQENTYSRVPFSIKLQASACNFIKLGTLTQVVFGEFCKIFKNTFFTEHLLDSASGLILDITHTHHCTKIENVWRKKTWSIHQSTLNKLRFLMFSGHVFWSETCSSHAENVADKCWNRRFRAFNFLCSQPWWGQWFKRQ